MKLDGAVWGLEQLAELLQQRFASSSDHTFVLLAAERWWLRANNSDSAITQRIPILRAAVTDSAPASSARRPVRS